MADTPDVSLETDRMDQVLEVPVPAQPVVMIQYRNRGVPWWVIVPLLIMVPIVAILVYHQVVVERYRVQAAEATHQMENLAELARTFGGHPTNPTAGSPGVSQPTEVGAAKPQPTATAAIGPATSPPALGAIETAVSTAAPPATAISATEKPATGVTPSPARFEQATALAASVGSAVPLPAAGGGPNDSPPRDSLAIAANGPSGGDATGGGQTPRARVRTVFPSPFDLESDAVPSNRAAADTITPAGGTPAGAAPDESHEAGLASVSREPTGRTASTSAGAREGGSVGKRSAEDRPSGAGKARGVSARAPREPAPALEPLPSAEEERRQIAEEAAQKERKLTDERAAQAEALRVARDEDRVKFHEELKEILETQGKLAGPEIDKLARRLGGDYNPAAFNRARAVWRNPRMTQRSKVTAIRSLGIPETAILNFMSDTLYARMRTPGGPRDNNEVRVKAAQLLLSFGVPGAAATSSGPAAGAEADSAPATTTKPRETDGRRPQ